MDPQKPKRPTTTCLHCGRPHTRLREFCSDRCRVYHWRALAKEGRPNDRITADDVELADDPELYRCGYIGCGRPLVGKRRAARYCSDACRQAAYRERVG